MTCTFSMHCGKSSRFKYDQLIFFLHGKGFDRRVFLFHLDLVSCGADAVGVENAATRLDVKLPAMPWAANDFALPFEQVFSH